MPPELAGAWINSTANIGIAGGAASAPVCYVWLGCRRCRGLAPYLWLAALS